VFGAGIYLMQDWNCLAFCHEDSSNVNFGGIDWRLNCLRAFFEGLDTRDTRGYLPRAPWV